MNPADQFEMIVVEHYERLFQFALSLTRIECDARDLTQQTFYVWATKGHQLRELSKAKTWLFTTLHRAFLRTRRRQKQFCHHSLDEVLDELPVLPTTIADRADCSQVLPALAQVDPTYRTALALFYLDDYSYGEIAQALDLPIGTVKSRIARGLAQLRELLLADGAAGFACDGEIPLPVPTAASEASSESEQRHPHPHARLAPQGRDEGCPEWAFSSIPARGTSSFRVSHKLSTVAFERAGGSRPTKL